jgi:hypothetical protein
MVVYFVLLLVLLLRDGADSFYSHLSATTSRWRSRSGSARLRTRLSASHHYLEALSLEANHTNRVNFFFPSHNGGKYLPRTLKDLLTTNSFAYDLPELDGLDNFHAPEVRFIGTLARLCVMCMLTGATIAIPATNRESVQRLSFMVPGQWQVR